MPSCASTSIRISIVCNLHDLDIARTYCDRLVGMAAGKLVFDGVPATLTSQVARDLYGLEADEAMSHQPAEVHSSDVAAPAAA